MRLMMMLVLALSVPAGCLAQGNLVPSGNFEQGLTEGWLTDVIVGPVEFSIDREMRHGGEQSLLLQMGKDGRGIARSPAFAVQPGAQYRVSVWVSAEGAPEGMVYARIHWWAGEPGVASAEKIKDDTEHAGGSFGWRELSGVATAPADAVRATIRLETGGDTGVLNTETAGPFWVRFDDLTVVPVQ
ncbi:MAG: carbohydrate binding domain-containing protein [Armatimonadota bacterium]